MPETLALPLAGRVALIAGGSAGIGKAIALRFSRAGATIAVLARGRESAAAVVEAARNAGGRAFAFSADVRDALAVDAAVEETIGRYGRMDLMVCSAGIGEARPFLDYRLEDWRRVIETNLTGTFICGQAAARWMVKRGQPGAIINLASISGVRASTGRAAYGASKAGVIALTRQMAVELAPHRIRVNALAPGPVDTAMVQAMHTPQTRAAYAAQTPFRRYGTPDEVASAALFLASEDAAFITGQVLAVDGGYLAAGVLFDDLPAGGR